MLYFLAGLVCLAIFFYWAKSVEKVQHAKARSLRLNELGQLPNFASQSIHYFSANGRSAIAINESSKKIALFERSRGWKEVDFADVLSSGPLENDSTGMEASATDRSRSAVIGVAVFGIPGAIAGANSNLRKVRKLDLRVTIDDLHSPIWDVNFLFELSAVYSTSGKYRAALDELTLWQSRLNATRARAAKSS